MPNGYSPDSLVASTSVIVGASATNTPISREYAISAGGSLHHVVVIDCASVTVSAGITAKLQTAVGSTWQDSKTVTISGNGRFYIKLSAETAGDQTFLPLLSRGRVVITTGAGDAVTVTDVNILQEL